LTILATISSFAVLLPLITGIFFYRRLPNAGRYITFLLAGWLIAEIVGQVMARKGIPNWNIYVLLSLFEIVIVTMFFKEVIINRQIKSVFVWMAWIGVAIVIFEYAVSNGPDNTISILFESAFFFAMGLYALYEMFFQKLIVRYSAIVLSLMFYFLGSMVYLTGWKFMKHDLDLLRLFADAHAYLMIACYLLFAYNLCRLSS
jgi:hypothetical protein